MHYLSLCLLIRNESVYLPEWLQWHRSLGVEHFYILDNGCNITESFGSDVSIVPFTGEEIAKQNRAYDLALREYGASTKWLGFIDTDEFIVSTVPFLPLLGSREHCSGIGLSWKMFGSSGHKVRQPSVLRGFTKWGACEEARHIKSLVQPALTLRARSPHSFAFSSGGCYTLSGAVVDHAWTEPDYSLAWLNHYWTRSEAEWDEKYHRGRGDGCGKHRYCQFKEYQTYANEQEDTLAATQAAALGI